MALAAVSAATFWGDFFLVLGSVLALFGLVTTRMTEAWTLWVTGLSACSLALAAAIIAGPDVGAYGDKHHFQAGLAFGVLMGTLAFMLLSVLRAQLAKRASGEEGEGDEKDGAAVCPAAPDGEDARDIDGEVQEEGHSDEGDDHLIGDRWEPPVQRPKEAPPEGGQGG